MPKPELIYLTRDNTPRLQLYEGTAVFDVSSATMFKASLKGADNARTVIQTTVTDKATGPIIWDQAGFQTGEVRLDFGGESLSVQDYRTDIIFYDAGNPNGVVWDQITIRVKPSAT